MTPAIATRCFCPPEQVRRMLAQLIHADLAESRIHAAADLLRRDAEVFGAKRHIVLHDVCDDLVIRVLEHHADVAAHINDAPPRRCRSRRPSRAPRPDKDSVHVLLQGSTYRSRYAPARRRSCPFSISGLSRRGSQVRPGIGVMYIFKPDDRVQGKFPFMPPSGSLPRRGDTVRCR